MGVIELEPSCTVVNSKNKHKKNYIDLVTPTRTYYFYCEQLEDLKEWVGLIRNVIDGKVTEYKPMPQFDPGLTRSPPPNPRPSANTNPLPIPQKSSSPQPQRSLSPPRQISKQGVGSDYGSMPKFL